MEYGLTKKIHADDHDADDDQDNAGQTVEQCGVGFIGKARTNARKNKCEDNAQNQDERIRCCTAIAKWLIAPVSAVKLMMNTLVPTAVLSS